MTLLRKILTISFTMLLAASVQAATKMERQQIPKLNPSLEIPQTLTPMLNEMTKIKYPSENRPQVIHGDERGKASLGTTAGRNALPTAQLDVAKGATLKMLTNFNPQVEPVTVDGYKTWLIIFHSQASDTEILDMLLITSQNEKAVQVSFNMIKDPVAQHQEAAKASLLSLRFE